MTEFFRNAAAAGHLAGQTGRIGDAHEAVERGRHRRAIDQRRGAETVRELIPELRRAGGIALRHRFGEIGQQLAVRNAAIAPAIADGRLDVVFGR
jgi:hypothetical protein